MGFGAGGGSAEGRWWEMRKFFGFGAALAVLTTAAVFQFAPVGSSTGVRQIHFIAHTVSQSFAPAPGSSDTTFAQGSHIYQVDELRNTAGKLIGHEDVEIHVASAAATETAGEYAITVAAVFDDGQLVVQGVGDSAASSGTIAVVGGTGAYRTAHGYAHYRDRSETDTDVVVTLL